MVSKQNQRVSRVGQKSTEGGMKERKVVSVKKSNDFQRKNTKGREIRDSVREEGKEECRITQSIDVLSKLKKEKRKKDDNDEKNFENEVTKAVGVKERKKERKWRVGMEKKVMVVTERRKREKETKLMSRMIHFSVMSLTDMLISTRAPGWLSETSQQGYARLETRRTGQKKKYP